MVPITEVEPIKPIMTKEPQLLVQHLHFVQVDVKHEHTVSELVLLGQQAMVHHVTLIEARVHSKSNQF